MDRKNTDDLSQELMSEADIDSYIKENQSYFTDRNVAELLTELYDHQRISKAELARRSGVSEVYLHQLFSGRRKPSRDKQRGDKHTESPPDHHLHTLSSHLPVFERYRPILRII